MKVVRAAPALAGIRRSTATAEPEKQHQHQKQQIAHTGLLACLALFCGWVQGVMGWMPADVPIYPAEATHDDTHGHEHPVGALHGHDQFHEDEPQAEEDQHGGHH